MTPAQTPTPARGLGPGPPPRACPVARQCARDRSRLIGPAHPIKRAPGK
jgi:hypothetical protein